MAIRRKRSRSSKGCQRRQPSVRRRLGVSQLLHLAFEPLEPRIVLTSPGDWPAELVTATSQSIANFQATPLAFEPADRQEHEADAFVARGLGFGVGFSAAEVSLNFLVDESGQATPAAAQVRMEWIGGNASPSISGVGLQPHVSHYLTSSNPSGWRTHVPNYAALRYDNVYPGIDLMFHGTTGELEYDWIVAPGSDPDQIVMAFDGAGSVSLNDEGQLVLDTSAGELLHRAPVLYQWVDGERIEVDGMFEVFADGTVGFEVGAYDADHPLVIDPIVIFSTTVGGSAPDGGNDVAVDESGNVYVTGFTWSFDLPASESVVQNELSHDPESGHTLEDAFVAVYTPLGELVWTTYLGGQDVDRANAIAVDEQGHVWIGGYTNSDDFPLLVDGQNTLSTTLLAPHAFVAKLSADGSSLLVANYLGGLDQDVIYDIELGVDGSLYVTGETHSPDFPTVNGLISGFAGGSSEAFVSRISPDGLELLFSTLLGGFDDDTAWALDVDKEGNIYVAGRTTGPGLPLANALPVDEDVQETIPGFEFAPRTDAFVTKIAFVEVDPGHELLPTIAYSTRLGGGDAFDETSAVGIAVSDSGLVAVVGSTSASEYFHTTENALKNTSVTMFDGHFELVDDELVGPHLVPVTNGSFDLWDAFVTVLDPAGVGFGSLLYSTFLGGSVGRLSVDPDGTQQPIAVEEAFGVEFGPFEDVYVTGYTASIDFPVTSDAAQHVLADDPQVDPSLTLGDAFFVKIDPFGSGSDSLIYGTYLGGPLSELGNRIAVDRHDDAYIVGSRGPLYGLVADATLTRLQLPHRTVYSTAGQQVRAFDEFSGIVGHLVSGREGASASDFEVTIDWGDGLASTASEVSLVDPSHLLIEGSHVYMRPGAYPVTMSVRDLGIDVDDDARYPTDHINASTLYGDQYRPRIAVDPTLSGRVFVVSADESAEPRGLFTSRSTDAGNTWKRRRISPADDSDFPAPLGPTYDATFDAFGNLYLAYGSVDQEVVVLASDDGGETFGREIGRFASPGPVSGISLATGPGPTPDQESIWIAYGASSDEGQVIIAGAPVSGPGAPVSFQTSRSVETSPFGTPDTRLPNMEIGPNGEVIVAWDDVSAEGLSQISATIDSDGLLEDESFGTPFAVPGLGPFGGSPILEWDLSGGERHGRLYLVASGYVLDEDGFDQSSGTDVFLLWSDDGGMNWNDPQRVNETLDPEPTDQIRPTLALDQETGNVAVSWFNSGPTTSLTLAASNDGGAKFAFPKTLTHSVAVEGDGSMLGASIAYIGNSLWAAWGDANLLDARAEPAFEIAVARVGIMDVPEPPLAIRPRGIQAVEDEVAGGVVATFTSRDPERLPDEFAVDIDWGDGSQSPGTILPTDSALAGTTFEVLGFHTYQQEGSYLVQVRVRDLLSDREYRPLSNVTHAVNSQSGGTIAVNPNLPETMFAAVNDGMAGRLMVATSVDGGGTWTSQAMIGEELGLTLGDGNPQAAFDRFGNLFLVTQTVEQWTVLLHSIDLGLSFSVAGIFPHFAHTVQPSVTTGPGGNGEEAVWITYTMEDAAGHLSNVVVQGAPVYAADDFGPFEVFQPAPLGDDGQFRAFGDIAVGPEGQVLVTYLTPNEHNPAKADLIVHLDPDGLGPMEFGAPIKVTETHVGAAYGQVPAMADRGINSQGKLAWYRGPVDTGRVYLTYVTSSGPFDPDTNIALRYSDDDGLTWSDEVLVTSEPGAQFMPAIAVDQVTGNVAVSYHSSLSNSDTRVEYKTVVSGDGGRTFQPPQTMSAGVSDATKPAIDINQAFQGGARRQLGDYTETAFIGGVIYSVWSDNSFELPENPDIADFDLANGRLGVADILGVPLVVQLHTPPAVEDEAFTYEIATFTDPDGDSHEASDYTVTIHWGDDTAPDETATITEGLDGQFRVTAAHTYMKKGDYDATVAIRGRKTLAVEVVEITVADAPLSAEGRDFRVVEGVPFTEVIATFIDENSNSTAADFTAFIEWSQVEILGGMVPVIGSGTIVLVGPTDGGNLYQVLGSHTYGSEQVYSAVTVITEDDGGQSVTAISNITSGDPTVAPISSEPVQVGALEDVEATSVTIARFELTGEGNIDHGSTTYSGEIDWGDGQTSDATIDFDGNLINVSGEHTYSEPGTYFPSVTLFDDSGGMATSFAVAHVAREVTNELDLTATGLVYNPVTQTFVGELNILNATGGHVTGPFQIVLDDLAQGANLRTATGVTGENDPRIQGNTGILFAGGSLPSTRLEFSVPDPATATVNYTPRIYAGVSFLGSSLDQAVPAQAASSTQGIVFEPNLGQFAGDVQFASQGPGYALSLTGVDAVLHLLGTEAVGWNGMPAEVTMRWVGGRQGVQAVGLGRQPGVSNYLIGGNPANWRTDIAHYARVRYDDIYDGIDLELYGSEGELEYDWVVAPGSDPSQIVLAFDGADALEIDAQGALQVTVGHATVIHRAPVVYQYGDGSLNPVDARYVLRGDGQVGFDIGSYDPTRTLVIDPVLMYASYFGGSFIDGATDVAVDEEGNTYVLGTTASNNLPTFGGFQDAYQGTLPGELGRDVFITKLGTDGEVIYSTYLGTSLGESAGGMAVDPTGAVYVVGSTESSQFPVVNAFQPTAGGTTLPFFGDGFITKLDPSGRDLVYSSYLGGPTGDSLSDVAVDAFGAAYVVGASDLEVTPTGLVAKIAPDGGSLVYRTTLGGTGEDMLSAIQVDAAGRVHVVGTTTSDDIPTPGGLQTIRGGGRDAYLATITSDGSQVAYGTYLGGQLDDAATDLVLDNGGRRVLVGWTDSDDIHTQSPLSDYRGMRDAFVATIATDGTLAQATYLGTPAQDEAHGVDIDSAGNILVAGFTRSADFPLVEPIQPVYGGGSEGFLARFNSTVSSVLYSTYLGGNQDDFLMSLSVGPSDVAHVVGTTDSTDLRTLAPIQPLLAGGGSQIQSDAFLARIAPIGSGVLTVANQPIVAVEGAGFDTLVATFSDTDSDAPEDYTATIDWGDGTITSGVIIRAGNGQFNVFGSHQYQRFGLYPMTVTIEQADGSAAAATSTTVAASANGFVDYRVTIDTVSLAGTEGVLAVQFNPAQSSGARQAQVTLAHFMVDGGTLLDGATYDGGAAGCLCDVVTISNSNLLNRLTQPIALGERIAFDLRLSGELLANPAGGMLASTLAVQVLAADGVTPLLTSDTSASVFKVDAFATGETESYVSVDPATGFSAVAPAAVNHVRIQDAPLSAQEVSIDVVEGVPFAEVVAVLTDANPFGASDEFMALIDWGDGSAPVAGTVVQDGPGTFSVIGEHVYSEVGQYAWKLEITSVGGSTAELATRPGIGGFLTSLPTFVGGSLSGMAGGDFDEDGKLDLVIADQSTNATSGRRAVVLFGNGDASFDPLPVPLGRGSLGVASADFNRDGFLDFATAGTGSTVSVVLGNGDRTFGQPINTTVSGANRLAAGDVNHDGHPDLLVGTFGCLVICSGGMTLLVGNGDGTFEVRPSIPTTGNGDVRIVDINGDAHADLVSVSATGSANATITIAHGNGNGSFQSAVNRNAGVPNGWLELGDLNGDDVLDIVLGAPGFIHVLHGMGNSTFATAISYAAGDSNRITLVDFDGDTHLDVISAVSGNMNIEPETLGGLHVLFNDGDGTLLPAVQYAAPPRPQYALVGDFNGDGSSDIAAYQSFGIVSVVPALGVGTLAAPIRHKLPELPGLLTSIHHVTTGDVDHDGDADVVAVNRRVEHFATVHLNHGDGTFQIIDVEHLVPNADIPENAEVVESESWRKLTLADVNHDGVLDLLAPFSRAYWARVWGDVNNDGQLELVRTTFRPEAGVKVLLGHGDGTFASPIANFLLDATGSHVFVGAGKVLVGDLDGDGSVDLIVPNGPNSGIFIGHGDGTFEPARFLDSIPGQFSPQDLALADFNGDGILDVAAARNESVLVGLGNGDGTFQTPINLPLGLNITSIAAADVNADGKFDVVTANWPGSGGAGGSLAVLIGIGDGSFAPAAQYGVGPGYELLVVEDFNEDGHPDLAAMVTSETVGGTAVLVLDNLGDGTFGEPVWYDTGSLNAFEIAAGQLTDDILPDLVAANHDDNTLAILVNNGSGSSGVRVLNAPLTALAHDINPVANVPFTTTVGRFDDTNTMASLGDHAAVIDWGDGSSSPGTIQLDSDGGFVVLGTHTYSVSGDYALTVRITDEDGGLVEAIAAARVAGIIQPILASPMAIAAVAMEPFETVVATFVDTDSNGSIADFTALIHWGDGTVTRGVIVEDNEFQVVGGHIYQVAGTYEALVEIFDIGGNGAAVTTTASVTSLNEPPTFTSQPITTAAEEVAYEYLVMAIDPNPGDELAITSSTLPSWLLLVDHADGTATLSGTPPEGTAGGHSVSLRVVDDRGAENTQEFTIEVANTNQDPLAADDTYVLDEDQTLTVSSLDGILANDTDVDGNELVALLHAEPAHGVLVLNADGSFTYTPVANFHGTDSFTYLSSDGQGGSDAATVNLVVQPVNDPPIANGDAVETDEGVPVVISVLDGDTDVDGDTLSLVSFDAISACGGTLHETGDGILTYSPSAGFSGQDTFQYTVSDGRGGHATATVTILVHAAQVPEPLDVTDLVEVTYFGTQVNTRTRTYYFYGTITNTSTQTLSSPISLVWSNLLPATGVPMNADGTTDEGQPFFNFASLVSDGRLDPGETSQPRLFVLHNPTLAPFSFDSLVTAVVGNNGAGPAMIAAQASAASAPDNTSAADRVTDMIMSEFRKPAIEVSNAIFGMFGVTRKAASTASPMAIELFEDAPLKRRRQVWDAAFEGMFTPQRLRRFATRESFTYDSQLFDEVLDELAARQPEEVFDVEDLSNRARA